MPKWAKVEAGQRVELKGSPYLVEAIKVNKKGTKATVTISGKAGKFTREVDATAKVELAATPAPSRGRSSSPAKLPKGGPLHDENGAMRRGATQGELDEVMPPTDVKTKGPWDEPKGDAEKLLSKHLGAKLLGATGDPDTGWFVPMPDPSTLAGHLLLFHDIKPEGDYKAQVKLHDDLHARALKGPFTELYVNHWHTEERPKL